MLIFYNLYNHKNIRVFLEDQNTPFVSGDLFFFGTKDSIIVYSKTDQLTITVKLNRHILLLIKDFKHFRLYVSGTSRLNLFSR